MLSDFWWMRIRGLWKLPEVRDRLSGKLDLVLLGGAVFSKSLIQFSVDGRGCVPSLLLDLRPNYGGGDEDNGDLLQKVPCRYCCTLCLWPWRRPPLTHTSAGDSWTLIGMSGSVSCGVTAPFSWVLVHTRFCLCPPWWLRVKHLPAMQETWVRSLGQEDPLEKEMATHSSTVAWKIPWTEKPGRPQGMGLQRVGHDWATSLSLPGVCFPSPVKVLEVLWWG